MFFLNFTYVFCCYFFAFIISPSVQNELDVINIFFFPEEHFDWSSSDDSESD
jgi:hypothetical protein